MNLIKKFLDFFKKRKTKKIYNALDVAKYIIYKCSRENQLISNTQLNIILYYCQKYYIKQYNQKLFLDDIHIKPFGPCIDKVYNYFCGFGSFPIYYLPDVEPIHEIDWIIESNRQFSYHVLIKEFRSKEKDLIC